MSATMTDIARKLKLSQSTISRVLNGKDNGRVSKEKAELIKKTADEMGYQINLAAVGLRKQKSYTIGILLPSPKDSYYGKMVAELQHLISQTKYVATFAFWETQEEAERAAKHILSRQVDAIITCEPKFLPDNISTPVASYGNFNNRFDAVSIDFEHSYRLRINYLVELGHKSIAYVGDIHDSEREKTFLKIINEKGLSYPWKIKGFSGRFYERDWEKRIMDCFDTLWKSSQHPTAVLTQNDVTAMLVLRRAWELGIKVPEDLSVIGVDNIPQSETCIPALTTVNKFSQESVAELLLDKVLKRIENKNIPIDNQIIQGELVIRESCAPPAGEF
ncbi:MAG: LacI family DNA-binding transcriptional regulator [Planctomycetota bacterium]|jgi:DNA-binding LacI/PurR family transcriptional regulator